MESGTPVAQIARQHRIHPALVHNWLRRPEATQSEEDMEIRDQIQRIVLEFPGYGYRRVTPELRRRGHGEV